MTFWELAVDVADLVYVIAKGRIVGSVTSARLVATGSMMKTHLGMPCNKFSALLCREAIERVEAS